MDYEYKHPTVRDGWGRSRVSYIPRSIPHWIDRRNGAVYRAEGNWVSIAIHRGGKLCWNHLGAAKRNMHAVRELANQYHEGFSAALDENIWRRDIIKV